jgi:hypothetical protein
MKKTLALLIFTIAVVAAGFCDSGIANGDVCCAKSCGRCGGSGCGELKGGSDKCCSGNIKKANKNAVALLV